MRTATCLALVCLSAPIAAGQGAGGVRPPVPTGRPPLSGPPRTAEDSAQVKRDSLRNQPLVKWAIADSVALELMKRSGYQVVRYRSEDVRFGAKDRTIVLTGIKGARSAVQRDPTVLVSDTIIYSDTSAQVTATGDTITMRDPARGGDVFAHGFMKYDLKEKEGVAAELNAEDKTAGQDWFIQAHRAGFAGDSSAKGGAALYGLNGTITSCTDSVPHYHFSAREIKRVSGSIMVARSVVLHIMDVPVLWLPFIFQDAREGRRSGILTPRFGLTELVRNSPSYRRNVDNLGYYFALSDYYDAQFALDWRSSARATDQDPGWTRMNGQVRYQWRDRFLSGGIALSRMALSTGSTNTTISWQHQQDFSLRSKLTLNFNYSTNTTVQRQTVINPLASVATIASQFNYQRDLGAVNVSIGGTQRQYPGRPQLDRDFPTLSISSKPIEIASWLVWSPSFNASSRQSLHMDAQGDFSSRFVVKADGTIDSVKVDRSTRTSELAFNTPFKLFSSQITLAVRAQDRENSFPELRTIVDPVDTSKRSTRVFKRTYLSTVDVDLNFSLPQLIPGPLHITPSVSLANVDPGAYFVRSERTGATWVSQSKRLSYGLGISPTFFGFFPGIGGVEKFRHAITPTLSYSYSPYAAVSAQYLAALGQTLTGYLGSQKQNRVTLGITQYIEAKLKVRGDTGAGTPPAQKVKVLSINVTPLTWDFERARLHKTGFATDNFSYSLASDLLPGLDVGADYSLFQGNVLSDSATFSPYLTGVHASFNLDARSPVVRLFARLFGLGGTPPNVPDTVVRRPPRGEPGSRLGGVSSVAGDAANNPFTNSNPRNFSANISFSKSQQRPPVGGRVIEYDPALQCAPLKDLNPLQYDLCVRNALSAPPQDVSNTATTAGGSFIRYPPQTNVNLRTSFNLTEKWSAQWSTMYDVERSQFGSQVVSLQRELHDWHAVFGFTQASNGNFAFTFFVSLNAEPDLKFNYDRSSYRLQNGLLQP